MSEKEQRNLKVEALLNGPPSADELSAAANVCERLATLIENQGRDFAHRPRHLRDTVGILRGFAYTTNDVISKRKS